MDFTARTVEAEGNAFATVGPSKRHMTGGYSGNICNATIRVLWEDMLCVRHAVTARSLYNKATKECFLCGPFRGYVLGSSCQHVRTQCLGYNWATLFLGDINMGTWPSRLGESQY
jgi:hypothetical protein